MSSFNLWLENLLFLGGSTLFFVLVGWAWRQTKPYDLPRPLPQWFTVWFLTVQLGGIVLPLFALLLYGVWWGHRTVTIVLLSYFLMLGLQILAESLALRQFRSVVFVMVPYLYIPYRIWQLYSGVLALGGDLELLWVRNLLIAEIVLWVLNYALDLAQLPRLLQWQMQDNDIEV